MDKCCRDLLRRVTDLIEKRIEPRLDGSERAVARVRLYDKFPLQRYEADYEIRHELDELLCEVERLGKDSDEV